MGLPQIKQDFGFSYKDYCQWDNNERWEIIDGIEYGMTAPSRIHQEISGELFVRMHEFFKNRNCKVYSAPFDVRLSEIEDAADDSVFTVVQPDITVVCDPSKLDDRGCKGAPDLIVEIISPSTVGTDMKIKRNLYEKFGVKEYWIVHPHDKIVMAYRLGKNNYFAKSEIYLQNETIESKIFENLKIKLSEIFATV